MPYIIFINRERSVKPASKKQMNFLSDLLGRKSRKIDEAALAALGYTKGNGNEKLFDRREVSKIIDYLLKI